MVYVSLRVRLILTTQLRSRPVSPLHNYQVVFFNPLRLTVYRETLEDNANVLLFIKISPRI